MKTKGLLCVKFADHTEIYPCLISSNTREGEAKFRISWFLPEKAYSWQGPKGIEFVSCRFNPAGHIALNENELKTLGKRICNRLAKALNYHPFLESRGVESEQIEVRLK